MRKSCVDTLLSDLFFNHEHPERDRLWKDRPRGARKGPCIVAGQPSEADERAAILKDALAFKEAYENIIVADIDAEALADDFLARI